MDIPAYPRHLSSDERQAVFEKASRDFVEQCMNQGAKAAGVSVERFRKSVGSEATAQGETNAQTLIALRWLQERVKALEDKADG